MLSGTLASTDRAATPWLIVTHHRPMYAGHATQTEWGRHVAAELEPLYVAHGVDVVFSAHNHLYMRSCPMVNGTCVAAGGRGPVHVLDGSGGAYLSCYDADAPYVRFSKCGFGYTRVTATPRQLTLEHIEVNTTRVIDAATLDRA